MSDRPSDPTPDRSPDTAPDDTGRRLFRYVVGDEWRDYRAIMDVVAGTFFTEFTPDEVAGHLAGTDRPLSPEVVADRLESLHRWGNLTVSSAVGSPTSLADYYRRRNRYLVTPAGQEVHAVVEGVLTRVDEVRDVSTGRLRSLLSALDAVAAVDVATIDPVALADLVRAVFDPHEAFTTEITQFFAAINQWQSRYDLEPEEFTFFAEVLVGYVAERLDEVERTARPIGQRLRSLGQVVPSVVERVNRGLSGRVAEAGLEASVVVRHTAGTRAEDWDHLAGWFVGRPGGPSRIEQLTREAVSAVRTLTLNLTRLSRVGTGASSRRGDFLRLARFFDGAAPEDVPRLAGAAFGLQGTDHYGVVAIDSDDPVSPVTSWWEAPGAPVPVSLRERGDTTNRGRPSPIPDRTAARRLVARRREQELDARRRVDAELLDAPLDERTVSPAALSRFQELVARTLHRLGTQAVEQEWSDGGVACRVTRTPGTDTTVSSSDGALTLRDLTVTVAAASASPVAAATSGTTAAATTTGTQTARGDTAAEVADHGR